MGVEQRSRTPRWLLIATGLVGLLAAILVVVVRYYEIRKVRFEAERARAEAERAQQANKPPGPSNPNGGDTPKGGGKPADSGPPTTPKSGSSKPADQPPPKTEEGLQPLFNGRDLSGWNVIRTLEPRQQPLTSPEGWAVQDGALVCVTDKFLWLRSEREYGDFLLRLEFKLPTYGANSGVYIRNPGKTSGLDGMSVQIMPHGNPKLPPEWAAGGIWNVIAPKVAALKPAGEWNALEIECRGSRVRVVLNGKVTVDADVNDHKALIGRPRSGYIGLANFQGEAKGIAFRNIRIKDLSGKPE